jgi:hypothetical protein
LTVPAVEGLLTAPYVTVAEFSAAPTWLDVDDLIEGGSAGQQQYELYNVLLRASAWADSHTGQRLGAHTVLEQARTRVNRDGLIYLHPSNVPVRAVTGVAYGSDFQNLTALTDLTQTWVEDARGIVVSMIPMRGSWSGSLEFGSVPRSGSMQIFIQYQYVAGYCSTTLSTTAASGGTSLTLADPTGLQAPSTTMFGQLAGSTARIWDPDNEEAVQVAPGFTGSNPVPLVAGLVNTHTVTAGPAGQIGISELPAPVHQAVIDMAVALMLREDVSNEEPFAGTAFGPAARRSARGGKAAGLLDHACELLEPYKRVR